MYGLVNKLLADTLRDTYGEAAWQRIASHLSFDATYFISMRPYPDEWSYEMVGAACAETGADPAQLLRLVGHRWVRDNSAGEYRDLFMLHGPDMFTFMSNLNSLHAALGNQMPGLKPPSFMVSREDEHHMRVRYYSHRAGLAPLVIGLLEGLCDFFAEPATVSLIRSRQHEQDYDEFLVARQH